MGQRLNILIVILSCALGMISSENTRPGITLNAIGTDKKYYSKGDMAGLFVNVSKPPNDRLANYYFFWKNNCGGSANILVNGTHCHDERDICKLCTNIIAQMTEASSWGFIKLFQIIGTGDQRLWEFHAMTKDSHSTIIRDHIEVTVTPVTPTHGVLDGVQPSTLGPNVTTNGIQDLVVASTPLSALVKMATTMAGDTQKGPLPTWAIILICILVVAIILICSILAARMLVFRLVTASYSHVRGQKSIEDATERGTHGTGTDTAGQEMQPLRSEETQPLRPEETQQLRHDETTCTVEHNILAA
ncbi:uncharacterized protein [Diadema antillarum]|uniref:uncharacterized protein n=1 Tax=Diadema antillarum TaxID=105358 RepID=UPI003A85956E